MDSNIDYNWDDTELDEESLFSEEIEVEQKDQLPTRHNLQLMRRLFHFANGFGVATLYLISLSHSQMIHLLGTVARTIYILEQIRLNYPETSACFYQ